jgi:hypothetical protein
MKVVIWGHKLHSHTHSYVHHGFYRAFQAMGHDVAWLDDETDVSGCDFSNTLFLTEGQVDKNIPLRKDCRYLLHYCDPERYVDVLDRSLFIERTMGGNRSHLQTNAQQIDDWTYLEKDYRGSHGWREFDTSLGAPALYILWATDLLPYEFSYDGILQGRGDTVNWVGTVGTGVYGNATELGPFALACVCRGKSFVQRFGDVPDDVHRTFIRESYLAPTIVGEWQKKHGYIPCRVFKNISYGQPTFTNSLAIKKLLEDRIPHSDDTFKLFFDAEEYCYNVQPEQQIELMKLVETKHTYVNRVKSILQCLP